LKKQRFKDFEVVVADCLYEYRPNLFDGEPFHADRLPFEVKHVPIHPNHRFWLDRGRWSVCGALNTAIIHSEGELLVRMDDCSEFDEDYLQKFWEGYQSGYWPMAMHTRYRAGRQAYYNKEYRERGYEFITKDEEDKRILDRIYREGDPIRDTRWPAVESEGRLIAPPQWYYGYSSVTLEAALKVNGFNELMDGDKSQEDQEFGLRLAMAGYKNLFLLEKDLTVIEHEHMPPDPRVIKPGLKPIKCNYAIYLLTQKKALWRANSERLQPTDIEFVRRTSLKPPCSPRPGMYQDDCNGPLFELWAEHQNIFDLREEAMEL